MGPVLLYSSSLHAAVNSLAYRWRLELYLTPGQLVYSTAGVLAALFLATAVLVLLLQTREKVCGVM